MRIETVEELLRLSGTTVHVPDDRNEDCIPISVVVEKIIIEKWNPRGEEKRVGVIVMSKDIPMGGIPIDYCFKTYKEAKEEGLRWREQGHELSEKE